MAKYDLSKEWIKKNGSKIKQGYNIALLDKYDIESKEDVLKILTEIDPENATEENAKIFSGVLKFFAYQLKRKFEQKQKLKSKTVN